jgi:hypothetical protein
MSIITSPCLFFNELLETTKIFYLSIMSIDQLVIKSYALRNLWEATLFDEKHNPMDWTTSLMVSTNIPKLKFTVEPVLAGSSKGYKGWELPDSLSIVMRETTDHSLEKYLDEWMMGETGIFNPKTGAFRIQDTPDFLYRNIRVRTFYYKYTSGENINVKIHEAIKRGVDEYIIQVNNETKNLTGLELSIKSREYLREQAYTVMANEYAKGNSKIADKQEYVEANRILAVEKKQVIPVVDKLTSLAGGVANQLVSKIPLSNLTRAVLPPLVIPPPLLKVPVVTGTPPPIPKHLKIPVKFDTPAPSEKQKQAELYNIRKKEDSKITDLKFDMSADIRKVTFDAVQTTAKRVVEITGGKAVNAKKNWKAEEVTTALVTYTCAIESYDIGTYDYQTGEGVQYTISLPVCDIKIEHES